MEMEKLRLCYISDPNSTHTRRWVGWFARHGHEVCLLADIPPGSPFPDVEMIDLSQIFYARVIRFPVWAAWVRRFLHRWQPDILHAHRVNSAGWLASASGFHPLVITPWGSDVFVQPQSSKLARLLARYTLTHADLVTVNSGSMALQVIQLGAAEHKVSAIQFGVELSVFNPSVPDTRKIKELHERMSVPEGAQVVLCPRALKPLYNIEVILQSIPEVLQQYPDTIFVFIDYNADVRYKDQLRALSTKLGIDARIRWMPPTNNREEMANLYRLSDIVVSVPSTDATPVSILEAMACGKPVIASDLPSIREIITSGEIGWLVPARQSQAISDGIIKLLSQPELTRSWGDQAYQVVSKKFNYEAEMERLEGIYTSLAGRARKSS
jgi:glycosyltransferase involved in cell wall biosynthesis